MRYWLLAVFGLLYSGTLIAQAQDLKIVENGISDYKIVVADNASPSTKWGAGELQHWLQEMTGAKLPIVSDTTPLSENEIIMGNNAHFKALNISVDFAKLGNEGYVLKTSGSRLVIAGGNLRGTMYGVFGLLEDHLGCRWFTPEINRIPKRSILVIPALNETQIPALEYREPFVLDCFDGDWCARNRMNSANGYLEEKHGGKVKYVGFVHTFASLVPPEKYFDEHPEYFSLINGKRMNGYYQLCLSNPEVAEIVIREVRQLMRDNPDAMVFSVSQNDTHGACQCDKCQEVVKREGCEAGILIEFVNKIAAAVKDEFPDKAIDTLAYQYTRKAPKTVRPLPNVIVRLCSIECCFSHPLATCDNQANKSFVDDIKDWAKISDRLWIWDYTTSFANYLCPFPNLRVLDDNIRFFAENHVTGIFEEDNYTSLNGELSPLIGYMMAKFLWNPNYPEDKAMNEFLENVYGAAAKSIRAYIDLLHDKVADDNIHMHIWEGAHAAFLTQEIMAQADILWDQAEQAVADNTETLKLVRVARLGHDWAMLEQGSNDVSVPYVFRGDKYATDKPSTTAIRFERFFQAIKDGNVDALSEGRYTPQQFRDKLGNKASSYDLVTLDNDNLKLGIIPELGGRLLRLNQQSNTYNFCDTGEITDSSYPATGGYAASWQMQYRGPGFSRSFTAGPVLETRQTKEIQFTTEVSPGITLANNYLLPKKADYFEVETTLKNATASEQNGDIRASFGFTLGDTDCITMLLDGKPVSLSLPAEQTEKQWSFTGLQLKHGLTFVNHRAGLGITLYPHFAQIDRAWLRVNANTDSLTFESLSLGKLATGQERATRLWVRPFTNVKVLPAAQHNTPGAHHALTVVAQDDQVGLGHYGEWAAIEADPKAEDGFAVHLFNNHIEWALQWSYLPEQFEPDTAYDVYARIRVDKKGNEGKAFWAGIYNTTNGEYYGQINPSMQEIPDNEYHMYKLGTVTPARGHYVWAGPQNNMDNAGGVYLDYIEMRAVPK